MPGSTVRSTPSRATTSPYDLRSSRVSIAAASLSSGWTFRARTVTPTLASEARPAPR